MAQRINLTSIIRQIHDLEREIESILLNSIIIHPDYMILNWNEIKRYSWGSFPYKIPYILDTYIEYKCMKDSEWHKIKTNSDSTTTCCFYKKNPIHIFSQSHQINNCFWNEYNAINEDFFYDIRICYKNFNDKTNWTTISCLGIPSLPPTFSIFGYLTKPIDNPEINQCYLILENENPNWQFYKNCLAIYNKNRSLNGWVIYYPRKGWIIDNFYFDGNKWIDLKLKSSMINLSKKITSKDILFKILYYGFSSRFFHLNTLQEYYELYI